jgi:hypothetical protein
MFDGIASRLLRDYFNDQHCSKQMRGVERDNLAVVEDQVGASAGSRMPDASQQAARASPLRIAVNCLT